jgi:hypothetical protein
MPEDQNPIDNVEIEPLSDEDLEGAAGGTDTSDGPSCCSCKFCSDQNPPIEP